MARHYRVEELLTPEHLETLKEWIREKNLTRTVDETFEWIQAHGYVLGRTAVWNWLDAFRMGEQTRRAAEISTAYLTASGQTDQTAVASAALRKFQELILDYVVRSEDADAGELMKLAIAMKTGVNTQQVIADLKAKQAEAIQAAEAAVKTGASGGDVVAAMKKALGIAA
jgi:hypothetical protein